MNAIVGPGPLEWILLILLGGGYGMPQAVPPTAETPLAAKVAPAECLFYASWAGTGKPDPESGNQTEQLLAEAEVQNFLTRTRDRMFDMMRLSAPNRPDARETVNDVGRLMGLLQGKPGSVFVNEITFDNNRALNLVGGGLLDLGDEAPQVQALLEKIQARAPEKQISSVQIGARTFHKIQLEEGGPAITWGLAGNHLLVGLGEGTLKGMMDRARGQAPEWLTTVRAKLTVPRFSSVAYLDVKRLLKLIVEENSGVPELAQFVPAMGLDKIQYFANVSGMDDRGCVSRSLLAVDGAGTGLLEWIDSEPLAASDVEAIPHDTPLALVFKLDPSWLIDLWLNAAERMEPRAAMEMRQELAQIQAQTGIDVRKDLIASLGDTWKIFARPGPNGLIGGWTVAVEIQNRQKLEQAHATFLALVKKELERAGPGGPSVTTDRVDGYDVHTLNFGRASLPVAPSWCLTDNELFISGTPESIKPLLAERRDGPSLAEHPDVAALFGSKATTLAVVYVDTREVATTLLPLLPALMHGLGPMMRDVDTANLPPIGTVTRHLQPSVFAAGRNRDGLALISRRTLPGANIGTTAPVAAALILPAVSAAREAARRSQATNHLKQIGIAMHNFHDTYKAFPAGYSANGEGQPLLSWRVHILPFVEQGELYNQFHLDESWDSPHNKALIEKMPDVYRSPGSKSGPGKTNYLGVSGADGVFVRPAEKDQSDNPRGTSFADVRDGTSNTVMIVEASDESAVTWTKPGDFSPDKKAPIKGLTGLRRGGFNAAFTDGSVRFLSETIDADTLNALFTKSGGEVVNIR